MKLLSICERFLNLLILHAGWFLVLVYEPLQCYKYALCSQSFTHAHDCDGLAMTMRPEMIQEIYIHHVHVNEYKSRLDFYVEESLFKKRN